MTTTTATVLRSLYRSICVSWHPQLKIGGAKFYCPHALAGGDQLIRIGEETLEFSSTVLSTLSRYLPAVMNNDTTVNI